MSANPTCSASPLAQWRLHVATEDDDVRLLPLFSQVFGHSISLEEWRWKYQYSPLRGSLLTSQGHPVAFFGGMARTCMYQGQEYLAVQNGDVMVHPSQRGIFSRRGAFYQMVSHFYGNHVGTQRHYAFAFGFPTVRSATLGLKLGLYQKAGRMQQLLWLQSLPSSGKKPWCWYWQPLHSRDLSDIDVLWQQMQASWPLHFLPRRDSAQWVWRYLRRPEVDYQLLILRRRLTGRPLAALALRLHSEHCHWLDYVGPVEQIPLAIRAARAYAQQQGLPVQALFSDAVAPAFALQGANVSDSDISIPTNASEALEQPWLDRLWLMGGDSDFM